MKDNEKDKKILEYIKKERIITEIIANIIRIIRNLDHFDVFISKSSINI